MAARQRIKRMLHRHAIEGSLRPLAAKVYDAVVAQEVMFERVLDAFAPLPTIDDPLLQELTAVIKTFERPKVVRRLVESITRRYPSLRIIVVDDSRKPVRLDGADTLTMPYDSGIAAGRNAGLQHVVTRYALILDDDYVFSRHTLLGPALALMEEYAEIDIMGGQLVELPYYGVRPLSEAAGRIFATVATPRIPLGSSIGGLSVCEKVPTFFIGRRDRLALVGWHPSLKRIDHGDFFTRAQGVLTTVFNPALRCFHARTPFDDHYMAKRMDLADSRRILEERYGGRGES